MSHTLLERCAFLAASAAGNPTHYVVEQALTQAELDWRFLTFEVDEDHLTTALEGLDVLGFRGVILAGEFRYPAVERLANLTPRAERAGSTNCLVRVDGRLVGDNTRGAALIEALGGSSALDRQRVLVIGERRVATTVAAALADAGASHVYMTGSDAQDMGEVIEHLGDDRAVYEAVALDDNIVHTPEGVSIVVFAPDDDEQTQRPVIDMSAAASALTLVDTRLRGSRTGLVKFATEQGATIIDGVELFARETALALELWTDVSFDRAVLQELAEEFLGV